MSPDYVGACCPCLSEIFLRRPVRHDVQHDHELSGVGGKKRFIVDRDIVNNSNSLEVDFPVMIGVIHPEDVLLQLLRVRVRVALAHHAREVLSASDVQVERTSYGHDVRLMNVY